MKKMFLFLVMAVVMMSCRSHIVTPEYGVWEYAENNYGIIQHYGLVHTQIGTFEIDTTLLVNHKYQNENEPANLWHSKGCDFICDNIDRILTDFPEFSTDSVSYDMRYSWYNTQYNYFYLVVNPKNGESFDAIFLWNCATNNGYVCIKDKEGIKLVLDRLK